MRRIGPTLEQVGIRNANELLSFPFNDLIEAPWGANIFLRVVDPVRGNDDNSGNTTSSAMATLQAAIDYFLTISVDMKLSSCILSGNVGGCRIHSRSNGLITLSPIFESNANDALFVSINDNNISPSDDNVIIKSDATGKGQV
ncbi:MAG: hypothetical protein U5K00_02085 [Melioribacteraceae bacterium]|nr:hypothetical protein [Melioribacteraceae bacterium]